MSLIEVKEKIVLNKNNEPFALNADTTGMASITQFLEQTIGEKEIYLRCVQIPDEGVTIEGKTSLPGVDDVKTTVAFQESAARPNEVDISMEAEMPSTWKFEIPGMTWFSVKDFVISLQTGGPDAEISGEYRMTISSGNTTIPISVRLPVDWNGWLVKGNFEKVDLIGGLNDLAGMVGLESLGAILPPGLEQVIESLTITDR